MSLILVSISHSLCFVFLYNMLLFCPLLSFSIIQFLNSIFLSIIRISFLFVKWLFKSLFTTKKLCLCLSSLIFNSFFQSISFTLKVFLTHSLPLSLSYAHSLSNYLFILSPSYSLYLFLSLIWLPSKVLLGQVGVEHLSPVNRRSEMEQNICW